MPRWMKVVRGMIGTGLTFGVGVGGLAAITAALVWLGHGVTGREVFEIAGKCSVVAFLLGVGFSGVLAITARGREFNKLSVRLIGGLGAGAGVLYWGFLALNGGRSWSGRDALGNLVILVGMGAVAASATLLIARKASSSLGSGDEVHQLGAGEPDVAQPRRSAKAESRRL